MQWFLNNEHDTVAAGLRFGRAAEAGAVVYLQGHLGAGKTTFCRGVLRAFSYAGAVKSPTYTLVESYQLAARTVNHFDLYRLGDPEELEYMGIRDYFDGQSVCLLEWPDRGRGFLPLADITVSIEQKGEGRCLTLSAGSDRGQAIINQLDSDESK
ncbi:MAG: tRNA (adenosine(37)-N6)-threonylcarbamoyltransferase complex ATPase subunit type 1 TsaE [Spongiibacteraceae bacterium]